MIDWPKLVVGYFLLILVAINVQFAIINVHRRKWFGLNANPKEALLFLVKKTPYALIFGVLHIVFDVALIFLVILGSLVKKGNRVSRLKKTLIDLLLFTIFEILYLIFHFVISKTLIAYLRFGIPLLVYFPDDTIGKLIKKLNQIFSKNPNPIWVFEFGSNLAFAIFIFLILIGYPIYDTFSKEQAIGFPMKIFGFFLVLTNFVNILFGLIYSEFLAGIYFRQAVPKKV